MSVNTNPSTYLTMRSIAYYLDYILKLISNSVVQVPHSFARPFLTSPERADSTTTFNATPLNRLLPASNTIPPLNTFIKGLCSRTLSSNPRWPELASMAKRSIMSGIRTKSAREVRGSSVKTRMVKPFNHHLTHKIPSTLLLLGASFHPWDTFLRTLPFFARLLLTEAAQELYSRA